MERRQMMPTDDDRREVARRLREIRPCKSGHIKWWEIARALGLKQPAGWFGWEKFEPDSVNRLADLIEPDHVGDSNKMVDRDALLALADEMTVEKGDIWRWSSRIREALGASDG